jgi:hypothetical protein
MQTPKDVRRDLPYHGFRGISVLMTVIRWAERATSYPRRTPPRPVPATICAIPCKCAMCLFVRHTSASVLCLGFVLSEADSAVCLRGWCLFGGGPA